MGKISVFESITTDGYFTDANSDMSFAHNAAPDPEFDSFTQGNASGDGILLMGRITYQMMVSFWPTPEAHKQMPKVAEGMNNHEKIIFSKSLDKVDWKNAHLAKGDLLSEVKRLKKESDKTVTILGSGTIVSQLTQAGLIDTYTFVVVPVVLGKGRTLFEGVEKPAPLKLTKTRSFQNGRVVLFYELQEK